LQQQGFFIVLLSILYEWQPMLIMVKAPHFPSSSTLPLRLVCFN